MEAVHLANLLCQFGYYFPVNELKNLIVKDDSSLYRFQVSLEPSAPFLSRLLMHGFSIFSFFPDTLLLAFATSYTGQHRVCHILSQAISKKQAKTWA